VTARGWDDLSQMIKLYELHGIAVDERLIAQYLQNKQIAQDFAIYYDLYVKYRSSYQITDILEGRADKTIRARAAAAKFDERYALLGMMLDAVMAEMKAAMAEDDLLVMLLADLKRFKAEAAEGFVSDPERRIAVIRRGEEEAMRHWDDIIALKQRIGIDETFHPTILHPLRPEVMTEKHRVLDYTFENMTPQAERFLRQKFHLKSRDALLNGHDSIDAELEQELTTSMRVDLFYQTAECRLVPVKLPRVSTRSLDHYYEADKEWKESDGVRVILSASDRKSAQLYAGVRFDTEEYAAVQLGLDIPLKTAIPINTDITLRLGKRLMARGEITIHPRSFTRPTLSYAFRRNDVDIYMDGDLDYNIRYNQFQAEFTPINFDLRHFNLQMGLRWDFMHYRNKLGSETATQVTLKNEHFFSYRAGLNYNSEDDWYFPSRGSRFNAEYAYVTNDFAELDKRAADGTKLGKKNGMSEVSANWRTSLSFSNSFTLQPMLYGRLLFGSITPAVFGNTIGGDWFGHYVEQQMPFAGIGNMEYVDHQFVAAQLQAQQRIGSNNYVLLRVAAAQQSNHLKELLDYRTLLGGQLAYYYNTMFGPVGATIGYSNRTKKPYFFLNLGYEF
jgi:NTE family protein